MSEPIEKEFFDKYKMCESCFYGWEECTCWQYKETMSLDKEIAKIDRYLKLEKEKRSENKRLSKV